MKRFVVLLITAVLITSTAYAIDHEKFSIYSELFGASDIDDSKAEKSDDRIRYYQDGCIITFRHKDGKIVSALIKGDGDKFLAYCYGIMMQFDTDSSHAAQNGGQLLGYYLMSHGDMQDEHLGFTVSGCSFTLKKEDEGFSFVIVK